LEKKEIDKLKEQLNKVLSFVDPAYIKALLLLQKTLDGVRVEWAVGGDLSEALETIQVEPDCIEIVTSKEGAGQIFSAAKSYDLKPLTIQTIKLQRNADINGIQYPIYIRRLYSEFFLGSVKIKVQGDMQYKIGDWDWGDKLEFDPEYVNVAGAKIAVVPLQVKYDIYQNLGWTDRAEKIKQALQKSNYVKSRLF